MKKIISYSGVLFMALTLTLGACKKKEDPAPSTPAAKTGILTCKVDGKSWESNTASQSVIFGGDTMPGIGAYLEGDTLTMLAFRVAGTDTSMVAMSAVLSSSRLGSYTLNSEDENIFYFSSINPLSMFATVLGYTPSSTLTITKYDATSKKFSGKFTCTMTSNSGGADIKVTDGEFTDVTFELE